MSKFIAYLRVSTEKQEIDNQKLSIMDYAHKENIKISEFIEVSASSKLSDNKRMIDVLISKLVKGGTLVVSELSRLGRSLGQIIQLIDILVKNKINFMALKENINLTGKQDMQNKVMITMFGLFAEIERDLISQRTTAALKVAKEKGVLLGRPKGSLSVSKLDGKEEEIKILLDKQVSKTSIARIFGISRTGLFSFIESRKIV